MDFRPTHTFHIPVMGLGFTIDTPIRVGHFGISSVVSIVEDHLIEKMRAVVCRNEKINYEPIEAGSEDSRARRICAYLDLMNDVLNRKTEQLRSQPFETGKDIVKYFELLPERSSLKLLYNNLYFLQGEARSNAEQFLRNEIKPGAIDVNIMTKIDNNKVDEKGNVAGPEYSDALSALRGFATSSLSSSVVFSAGLNPRLYSYCENFPDFFPDQQGIIRKKIILKVSDYRSALIQGKFLAKKGLWVSEFRIESGLNCGGHAFATDGLLMGPILEEFKTKRRQLHDELFEICQSALISKGSRFITMPELRVTAQGGIGTSTEDQFLLDYYELDATGWGSPFLLVPEATCVDDDTLKKLANAKREDYYLSHASPLGVPFNNFRPSSSEEQRKLRISKGRAGSPCYKKFLSFNTEFTEKPICTASREYQNLKIKQAKAQIANQAELEKEVDLIVEKDCLCEGLGAPAILKNEAPLSHKLKAVVVCPGPNLAFFSGVFSLREMIDHIYGRTDILNSLKRPVVFVNELVLYIDYLKNEMSKSTEELNNRRIKYFELFQKNLLNGIEYYQSLLPGARNFKAAAEDIKTQLEDARQSILALKLPLLT